MLSNIAHKDGSVRKLSIKDVPDSKTLQRYRFWSAQHALLALLSSGRSANVWDAGRGLCSRSFVLNTNTCTQCDGDIKRLHGPIIHCIDLVSKRSDVLDGISR